MTDLAKKKFFILKSVDSQAKMILGQYIWSIQCGQVYFHNFNSTHIFICCASSDFPISPPSSFAKETRK